MLRAWYSYPIAVLFSLSACTSTPEVTEQAVPANANAAANTESEYIDTVQTPGASADSDEAVISSAEETITTVAPGQPPEQTEDNLVAPVEPVEPVEPVAIAETVQPDEKIEQLAATEAPEQPQIASINDNTTTTQQAMAASSADYIISPYDILDVKIAAVDELSGPARVSGKGEIQLPLINTVPAAGKTALELEQFLTELYGKDYLQNPKISVTVKEIAPKAVVPSS